MSPRPELVQRASLLGMAFVIGMYVWMYRKWVQGPETQVEKDQAHASKQRPSWEREGRVRIVSQTPEWLRRFERKVMGVKRLGDRKLQRSER